MTILGIETTCDETGVGIVEGDFSKGSRLEILASVVSSSADLHKKYRGVVPEVAAREQVKVIIPVLNQALSKAGLQTTGFGPGSIDAIAVAYGPGLVGSLLIGVETAKTLAVVWRKPLIPINHLIGHVYANWIKKTTDYSLQTTVESDLATAVVRRQNSVDQTVDGGLRAVDVPLFPLTALIVSGGHTDLILMTEHGKFRWLGGTRDDAAGEAFDKVARVLGLGYPGGPEIERVAQNFKYQISNIKFPRPMIDTGDFDFSFSGLKTAVVNLVTRDQLPVARYPEVAYEFQQAIVDVLVKKTFDAAKKYRVKSIVLGGGVAANESLRTKFSVKSSRLRIPVYFPEKKLSVDNGVMIAAAAFYSGKKTNPLKLSADPGLHFA